MRILSVVADEDLSLYPKAPKLTPARAVRLYRNGLAPEVIAEQFSTTIQVVMDWVQAAEHIQPRKTTVNLNLYYETEDTGNTDMSLEEFFGNASING